MIVKAAFAGSLMVALRLDFRRAMWLICPEAYAEAEAMSLGYHGA